MFQFQAGSIKGPCRSRIDEKLPVRSFQFQAGSIKGGAFSFQCLKAFLSFNSRLVRLKGKLVSILILPYRRFQFQAGSIKGRESVRLAEMTLPVFQFQAGSIKGLFLKQGVPIIGSGFQFQAGSIKGYDTG